MRKNSRDNEAHGLNVGKVQASDANVEENP